MVAGIADMNPKSFPDFSARTPQCQSLDQPGGFNALKRKHLELSNYKFLSSFSNADHKRKSAE